MKSEIRDLHEEFRDGQISRREYLRRMAVLTGSAAAVLVIHPDDEVRADIIDKNDPRLETRSITYPTPNGQMMAYVARPKGEDPLPAVIVIHENRGLNDHIRDVTRRMALEGFLALAPDGNSPTGGTPDDPDKARDQLAAIDSEVSAVNFTAAAAYLKTHPQSTGKVGCTGFCWGGAMTNQVAVRAPELDAAVPYYGRQPAAEDVAKIKADLMCHYAGEDERINAGIPAFEEALKKAGIEYQIFIYDGAYHAFNNDTGQRYDEAAAKLAWQRTVVFFNEKLKA
ncbi:MAG: dienelactone hydrolase family protein [Acidobacteriota bacterium]